MLAILHSNEIVNTRKHDWKTKQPIMRLKYIMDYSCNMGAVDRTNVLLSYAKCIRKSAKWYKKLSLHILNVALLNAHALYMMQNEKGMSLPDFQMSVIRGLLEKHEERRISSRGGKCLSGDIPQCVTDDHFPDYVPSTAGQQNAMRKCHVCVHLLPSTLGRGKKAVTCAVNVILDCV
jgi:hypothetical protein